MAATLGNNRRAMFVLILLTAVTGLVDAASVLGLGHVFTGNMTGNVLLLGFSLGRANDVSIAGSLTAVAGFLAGAMAGSRFLRELSKETVKRTLACESMLLLAGVALAAFSDPRVPLVRSVLLLMLAGTMGLQSAAARRLGIAKLSTVVITSTLTDIAIALVEWRAQDAPWLVPVAAVLAMLLGALAGAILMQTGLAWTVGAAFVLQAAAFATLATPIRPMRAVTPG